MIAATLLAMALLATAPAALAQGPGGAMVAPPPDVRTGTAMVAPPQPRATEATLQSYAIVYRPGPAWRAGQPMQRQALGPHVRYWQGLQAQGRVFSAGALGGRQGLAIISAGSLAEARRVMVEDPAVRSGVFRAEVQLYGVRFRGRTPVPLAEN